ncbi:hypothetical protein Aduo_007928 [Ancylostoma duodenale]
MAQSAMLKKLAHFLDAQGTCRERLMQACINYNRDRCPSPMIFLPDTMVVRLTTMIEIVDGTPLDEVPDHRRDAYVYAALEKAIEAYDDDTDAELPDIQAALLRTDLCAASHFCGCEECGGEATLKQHKDRGLGTRYPFAPLLQLGLGGPERMVLMEQVWLRLPRVIEWGRRNIRQNPWEVLVPEPEYPRQCPSDSSDEEFSDSEQSTDGVYTSDEEGADA